MSRKERKQIYETNQATYMIISASLLYFGGNALDSLLPLMELCGIEIYYTMPFFIVLGNMFLFASHGLDFVIYFNYCKEYNRIFKRTIFRQKPLATESNTGGSNSVVPNQ